MRALGDLDAVEHHHRQAHVLEAAAHQLGKRGAGARDEHVRDDGLASRARALLELCADGLADAGEAARGDAREHAVHHHPRERVAVGEVLIRLHGQLVLVVGRAHPRTRDLHAPAAERHRAVLVAVALCGSIRIPRALRAHDLVDLELHQFVHDAEPDSDAQREQALLRRSDELAERLLDLRWERTLRRLQGRDDLGGGYLLHGGSSCPRGLGWRLSRSQRERTRREDRRSKFYEISDNLVDNIDRSCAFRAPKRASECGLHAEATAR